MRKSFSRRRFLGTSVAALGTASLLGSFVPAQSAAQEAASQDTEKGTTDQSPCPSRLFKALITNTPTDDYCQKLKAAGFDGMEVTDWDVSVEEARKRRRLVEPHGLRIHSVMRGWTNFNQAEKFETDLESVRKALRAASAYGADTILLVPCRVGGMKMPEPWDFDIDFDPKTLVVKSIAEGDNTPYADYISAQNIATEQTIRAVEQLIPTAAQEGVRIGIENVWNNLWCTPNYFAALCKYFDNPWVGCYFDLGNHTKYARCEEWLKALGTSIVKLHIKGYKVTEPKGKLGGGPGDWCKIDQASIDWKLVRKILRDNRYSGWLTVEESGYSMEKFNEILDEIITG